jgi:hypothetical protein
MLSSSFCDYCLNEPVQFFRLNLEPFLATIRPVICQLLLEYIFEMLGFFGLYDVIDDQAIRISGLQLLAPGNLLVSRIADFEPVTAFFSKEVDEWHCHLPLCSVISNRCPRWASNISISAVIASVQTLEMFILSRQGSNLCAKSFGIVIVIFLLLISRSSFLVQYIQPA